MDTVNVELVRSIAERTPKRIPLKASVMDAAERILGFALPPLLRELYLTCGNGGFWPGLLPLLLGDELQRCKAPFPENIRQPTSIVLRALNRAGGEAEPATWRWPPRLVEIYDFGCTMVSCVDALDPRERVVRMDGNCDTPGAEAALSLHPNGFPPLFVPPEVGLEYVYGLELEARSLEDWLERWLRARAITDILKVDPRCNLDS